MTGLSEQMDRWAAKLDARFKRAIRGEGCWNCGCPDAQYVRLAALPPSAPPAREALLRAIGDIPGQPFGYGTDFIKRGAALNAVIVEHARLQEQDRSEKGTGGAE